MIKNRTIHIICTCLLSCVLLMLSIQTKAQQYPFINYDQSKLYLAKDSSQMMSFYKKQGYDIKNYPVTFDNYAREISLPVYYDLTDDKVSRVIKAVTDSVKKVIR